jgi:hypothetical protein
VTILARNWALGMAKEPGAGTYTPPTWAIPFTKASFDDTYTELKDESVRADDSVLHGLYQGIVDANWDIECLAYPDLVGMFLRSVIGPDTITAATAGTITTATTVGANSIPTSVAFPAGSLIMIDTGVLTEYAVTGAASTGTASPYTTPIASTGSGTTLALAHASGVAVTTPTTHTFKQSPNTAIPTYSFTVFDGLQTLGYASAKISELQVKIDPKASVSLSAKALSFPGTVQPTITESYLQRAPFLGWGWTMSNGGSTSTRGISYDATLKRATEALHLSTGLQTAREIFSSAMEADVAYKAVFESMADLNLYLGYSQQPATATITQPLAQGGRTLALTMSQSGWYKGSRDGSGAYVAASFSISGIANTTDGGVASAVLTNYTPAAY